MAAAVVPMGRAMEAALFVLSSSSDGAAAAASPSTSTSTSRVLNAPCRQFSAASCSSSRSFSSSSCISRQSNHGPSGGLQVSHSSSSNNNDRRPGASSVVRARKKNGKLASRRAPETASKGGKARERSSGGSVALRDPESAPVPAEASSSVNRNLSGTLVGLRVPESVSHPPSPSAVTSDLIGGLIALRAPETTTLSVVSASSSSSSSAELNPLAVDTTATAGEVRLTPAETSEEAMGKATLSSLILVQEAKLFSSGIFKASKLQVLLLGKHDDERPLQHPRIYTLTHSDLTAMITLAVAREINKAQVMGWYCQLQRDEVVAEWRRTQGEMTLHVHCHISGTNFLHRLIAKLRFYIFQKELPLVLEAFMAGDRDLFSKHPELLNAPVWVYFHSNVEDYNRVECWGPLLNAIKNGVQIQQWGPTENGSMVGGETEQQFPGASVCLVPCECCSRHETVIPIPESLNRHLQQTQLQRQSKRKGASQSSSFRFLSGPT